MNRSLTGSNAEWQEYKQKANQKEENGRNNSHDSAVCFQFSLNGCPTTGTECLYWMTWPSVVIWRKCFWLHVECDWKALVDESKTSISLYEWSSRFTLITCLRCRCCLSFFWRLRGSSVRRRWSFELVRIHNWFLLVVAQYIEPAEPARRDSCERL